jgi:hypothetical protein
MLNPDMETKVVAVTAPTTEVWAVFTSDEGEPEIWTQRVHLWAQTRTALPPDLEAEEEFLDRDVPRPRDEIVGMVIMPDGDGDLISVKETGDWLFMGYSENQNPSLEGWRSSIESARRRFKREMGEMK